MQLRTHLALGLAVALYFLPHVNDKITFIPIILIATLIPIADTVLFSLRKSYTSPLKILSPIRKILRTYTLCILATLLLALFSPIYALPFFLGYSFTLFIETFSTEGIMPFWPYKKETKGHIVPGGTVDNVMFYIFAIFNVALLAKLVV